MFRRTLNSCSLPKCFSPIVTPMQSSVTGLLSADKMPGKRSLNSPFFRTVMVQIGTWPNLLPGLAISLVPTCLESTTMPLNLSSNSSTVTPADHPNSGTFTVFDSSNPNNSPAAVIGKIGLSGGPNVDLHAFSVRGLSSEGFRHAQRAHLARSFNLVHDKVRLD